MMRGGRMIPWLNSSSSAAATRRQQSLTLYKYITQHTIQKHSSLRSKYYKTWHLSHTPTTTLLLLLSTNSSSPYLKTAEIRMHRTNSTLTLCTQPRSQTLCTVVSCLPCCGVQHKRPFIRRHTHPLNSHSTWGLCLSSSAVEFS